MNRGTKIRTFLAIVTALNDALLMTDLTEFNNETVDLIYKIISTVLNFIVMAGVAYYNNDYTEIASIKTGEMRQAKAEQDPDYQGERFFDEEGEDDE